MNKLAAFFMCLHIFLVHIYFTPRSTAFDGTGLRLLKFGTGVFDLFVFFCFCETLNAQIYDERFNQNNKS